MSLWLPVLCLYYGKHPQYRIFPFAHPTKSIQFNFHLLKVWHETFLAADVLDKFTIFWSLLFFLEKRAKPFWILMLRMTVNSQFHSMKLEKCYSWSVDWQFLYASPVLASFPGHRRNGLATSASSNCYFCCPKVGSTNQISERSHMTTVKPNYVMHWTVAVMPIPLQ